MYSECLTGVLPGNIGTNCGWYDVLPESSTHLFLHYNLALGVWYHIFNWLGVVVIVPPNLFNLFACLSDVAPTKRVRKVFRLIWHSVIWTIWNARNNRIFNNVRKEPLEVVEDIKVLSWRWSADRLKITPCLFYEWSWDPGACFKR
jgi:hypothetical protein